jgi:uncharacterized protein YggE
MIVAVALGGFFYIHGKKLETRTQNTATISVSGEGKTSMSPDVAQLQFGVQVQREQTAKQAMSKLSTQMKAVIDAVKQAGVPDKDIRTESLSLNPAYDWTDKGQVARGFDASQSLSVKVRDLDRVSEVLSVAANAGANNIGGVNFTIDDPEQARATARKEAITQAQEKAKILAGQLGMNLGKLQGFSEGGGGYPPMPYRSMAGSAMMEKDVAVNAVVPAGEEEIQVQVTLTYELR